MTRRSVGTTCVKKKVKWTIGVSGYGRGSLRSSLLGAFAATVVLAVGTALLLFKNFDVEPNNVGNILDKMSVSDVPELATWAMMSLDSAASDFSSAVVAKRSRRPHKFVRRRRNEILQSALTCAPFGACSFSSSVFAIDERRFEGGQWNGLRMSSR